MDINDHGTIKWTAMMLPEHKELLKQMEDKLLNDVEKPMLSEDKLEKLDQIINNAIEYSSNLKFVMHKNKRINIIEGQIEKLNYAARSLRINTKVGFVNIAVENLIDIFEI